MLVGDRRRLRKVGGQLLDRAIEARQRVVVGAVGGRALGLERLEIVRALRHRSARRPVLRPGCWRSRTASAECVRRRYARRPARTASFIASAIATGSCAPAIAVFISTPSAPSSIASAASDAVPTPASTISGTRANSRMMRMLFDVLDAEARANRRAERHDRRGAGVFELAADDRIVVGVGQHDEPFLHQHARRLEQRLVVGKQRPLVADHFELHPVRQPGLAAEPRRADRFVGGVAAGGVRQDEVLRRVDVVEQRFLRCGRRCSRAARRR